MDEAYCLGVLQALKLTLYKGVYWSPSFGEWPLYPYAFEESIRDNEVSFSQSNVHYMIIVLILEGEVTYSDGMGNIYHLDQGKMFVIPQGAQYTFTSTPLRHYHKLVLELEGAMLPSAQQMLGLSSCRMFTPPDPHLVAETFYAIRDLLDEESENQVPRLIGLSWQVLTILAQCIRDEDPQERLIARARGSIELNLQSSVTIKKIAEQLGISHSLLDRMFRKAMGVSPQQYRVAYRFRQAQYLLLQTTHSIKQIAAKLGYANQLYFSNEFKKNSGISPKEYRNKRGICE